jgi:hypothetical protein
MDKFITSAFEFITSFIKGILSDVIGTITIALLALIFLVKSIVKNE